MGEDLYCPSKQDKAKLIDHALTKPYNKGGLSTMGFMLMLASFEGFLLIYKDIKLAWAMKMELVPIFLDTATFQSKKGLIVTLSDNGHLQVSFVGTEQMTPTDLGKLHQNEQEIDYQKMDEKHREILVRIKNSESEQSSMPTDHLSINIQLSRDLEQCTEYLDDPDNVLARNLSGQLYRQKMKVLLSY